MSPEPKRLLIPMHVDALVVGKRVPFRWATLAPDFSRLRKEYKIGPDLRFPFVAGQAMRGKQIPQGIHLHFRLPPVLTHASGKDTTFLNVPNLWLVQRYYTEKNRRLTRAWMVYSDRESKDKDAVVLPVFRQGEEKRKCELRPTGETVLIVDEDNNVINNFAESDTPAQIALTAVAAGDAGFAAHYPACRGILGFYDDLKGVLDGTELSYLVTGWYSSDADDPWHRFLSENQLPSDPAPPKDEAKRREIVREWLAEHRAEEWQGFEDDKTLPTAMLCHGLVRNVYWNSAGYDQDSAPKEFRDFFDKDPEKHWVDIGNNSAEALAARLSKMRKGAGGSGALLEDIVTAFQTGLLSQGPGVSEMDADIHRHGFASIGGGQTWSLEPEETNPMDSGTRTSAEPVPRDLQEKLDDLNRRQAECDKLARQLSDYQWELYALWHRWTYALKEDEEDQDLAAGFKALKDFVSGYTKLPQHIDASGKLTNAIAAIKEAIPTQPSGAGKPRYTLVQQPSEPFYAPSDPVVTITGPAMEALGTDPRLFAASCRVTGQELRKFTYKEKLVGRTLEIEATADWLKKQIAEKYLNAIPAWCKTLLGEALLRDEMRRIEKEKDAGQEKYEQVTPAPGNFPPANISDFLWKHNPWIPLYLYWKIKWTPDYKEGESLDNAILSRWKLNDPAEGEIKYQKSDLVAGKDFSPAGKVSTYSGYTLLGRPLLDQRLNLAESAGQSGTFQVSLLKQIKELFPAPRRTRMTSQSLGGFHNSLVMRRTGDQLPPFSFNRWKEAGHPLYLDDEISAVWDQAQAFDSSPFAPGQGGFVPLRAGRFALEELYVVDAFGQAFELLGSSSRQISVCASGRLAASTTAGKDAASLQLQFRPRFCRPMRLAFTGASAANPDALAPSFSPICGWIVANHFEKSLILYAANGRPFGALQTKFGKNPGAHLFYWVPVPGLDGPSPNLTDIPNKYLRGFAEFVLGLTTDEGRAFSKLIDNAVSATELRVPENNSPVSALVGRPLALIRAELRLETAGLHALDQSKSWIAQAPNKQADLKKLLDLALTENPPPELSQFMWTAGAERILCPLRLGDGNDPADGLAGFFLKEDLASGPFYASWGLNFGNVKYRKLEHEQDLRLDAVSALQVTLLMDPRARVHATSGILPRVFFGLPAAEAAGARQVREVFFQAAPALGTSTTPQIPKPSDDYGQWSWACRPPVTGNKQTPYSERPWHEDSDLLGASDRADIEAECPMLNEGWLKLKIAPVRINDLWLKKDSGPPKANTNITLVWSLQGADWVQLSCVDTEKLLGTWKTAPLATEYSVTVERDTTYELVARDQAGYEDRRKITIQVES